MILTEIRANVIGRTFDGIEHLFNRMGAAERVNTNPISQGRIGPRRISGESGNRSETSHSVRS